MVSLRLGKDGEVLGYEVIAPVGLKGPALAKWGHAEDCQAEEFGAWMEDGQCSCGVWKHHEHCSCGGLVQVG